MLNQSISIKLTPVFKPRDDVSSVLLGFCGDALLMTMDGSLPSAELFERLGKPRHSFHIGEIEQELYTLLIWEENITLPNELVKNKPTPISRLSSASSFCDVKPRKTTRTLVV